MIRRLANNRIVRGLVTFPIIFSSGCIDELVDEAAKSRIKKIKKISNNIKREVDDLGYFNDSLVNSVKEDAKNAYGQMNSVLNTLRYQREYGNNTGIPVQLSPGDIVNLGNGGVFDHRYMNRLSRESQREIQVQCDGSVKILEGLSKGVRVKPRWIASAIKGRGNEPYEIHINGETAKYNGEAYVMSRKKLNNSRLLRN